MSSSAPSPTTLSERFGWIIAAVCELVGVRGSLYPPIAPIMNLAWRRLSRTRVALCALIARFQAGKLRAWSTAPRRPSAKARAPAARPPVSLPRRSGWLLLMMPTDIGYGVQVASFRARMCAFRSQLTYLLTDPEMVALIEASPQARRLLRPLCNMLMIKSVPAALLRPAAAAPLLPSADQGSSPTSAGETRPDNAEAPDDSAGTPAGVPVRFNFVPG